MDINRLNYENKQFTTTMEITGCQVNRAKLHQLLEVTYINTKDRFKSEHAYKTALGRVRTLVSSIELDGAIHPHWTYNGQKAGRWTSERPSLQNTTEDIRACFDTYSAVDVDQMELYVAAVLAGEQKLVDAYHAGQDLHQAVADELTLERDVAKVFNLANLYGQTYIGIASRLRISDQKAIALLQRWWDAYPNIRRHKRHILDTAWEQGEVSTHILSFKRTIDRDDPHWENQAYSTVVQGTAADIMKLAFHKAYKSAHPIYAVLHDEFWCHPAHAAYISACIAQAHPDFRLRVKCKKY